MPVRFARGPVGWMYRLATQSNTVHHRSEKREEIQIQIENWMQPRKRRIRFMSWLKRPEVNSDAFALRIYASSANAMRPRSGVADVHFGRPRTLLVFKFGCGVKRSWNGCILYSSSTLGSGHAAPCRVDFNEHFLCQWHRFYDIPGASKDEYPKTNILRASCRQLLEFGKVHTGISSSKLW